MKIHTRYHSALVQLFCRSFFRHLAYAFPGKLRREMPPGKLRTVVVSAFTHVFILCKEIITPVCQYFRALPEYQAAWHIWVSQRALPIMAVIFNYGYMVPQGSVSGCKGFCRNRPNFPGMKLQLQFYTVVAIQALGSLHGVPWATPTFAEGSIAAKR